ncbi:MAG: ATP-binding cassette domain-containing protein, partial [Chloroflexota bacterium]
MDRRRSIGEAVTSLRERQEWTFFAVLSRADRPLAIAWWLVLLLRGALPAVFAVAMGVLVAAVQHGSNLAAPLALAGGTFFVLQVLTPIHGAISGNLGDRTAAWLYSKLTDACLGPPGIGHLEDPKLAADLSMARDFDLGITAPPLNTSVAFIAASLVEMAGGFAMAILLATYAPWAAALLTAVWLATHYLLRESAIWQDRNTYEVKEAQHDSDYTYQLAVEPPAAKELRLFGLAGWTLDRFVRQRTRLFDLQYHATRLRERPLIGSLLLVLAANALVLWFLAHGAISGSLSLGQTIVYVQAAVGISMIAFGGLDWSLDPAASATSAVLRLGAKMEKAGALSRGVRPASRMPAYDISFRDVSFAYNSSSHPVLDGLDLTIPAGSSLAIVGQNGAGKTTLAKLLCRLYDPQSGSIQVDGVDLRDLDLEDWRRRVAAVFQDFTRFELPLRDNVAPSGAPDDVILESLAGAGASGLAGLDTILARGYEGGTELSGGQWQRVALARALCSVQTRAGLILLDEPTAQLDVRGEVEIFRRILDATRGCTTILI